MSTMTIDQMMDLSTRRRVAPELRTARPAPRPIAGQVRLTRRGRLVIFLGALLVVLALGVVWGAGSVATSHPGTPAPTEIVTVAPGDTLYDIAAGVADDGQVGEMVEQLQQMNGLSDASLQVGQHLRVPLT